jgi:hypothetical protein
MNGRLSLKEVVGRYLRKHQEKAQKAPRWGRRPVIANLAPPAVEIGRRNNRSLTTVRQMRATGFGMTAIGVLGWRRARESRRATPGKVGAEVTTEPLLSLLFPVRCLRGPSRQCCWL